MSGVAWESGTAAAASVVAAAAFVAGSVPASCGPARRVVERRKAVPDS